MKTRIAIMAVSATLAAVPATAADGIQPGLWKITTTVLNNGAQMPPQTKPRCLTAEQAGDLAGTFSPRFGGVNATCQRMEYTKTDQKLTWRLECRGQFNMDSAAAFTFFQSDPLHGRHLDQGLDGKPADGRHAGDARRRICWGLSVNPSLGTGGDMNQVLFWLFLVRGV